MYRQFNTRGRQSRSTIKDGPPSSSAIESVRTACELLSILVEALGEASGGLAVRRLRQIHGFANQRQDLVATCMGLDSGDVRMFGRIRPEETESHAGQEDGPGLGDSDGAVLVGTGLSSPVMYGSPPVLPNGYDEENDEDLYGDGLPGVGNVSAGWSNHGRRGRGENLSASVLAMESTLREHIIKDGIGLLRVHLEKLSAWSKERWFEAWLGLGQIVSTAYVCEQQLQLFSAVPGQDHMNSTGSMGGMSGMSAGPIPGLPAAFSQVLGLATVSGHAETVGARALSEGLAMIGGIARAKRIETLANAVKALADAGIGDLAGPLRRELQRLLQDGTGSQDAAPKRHRRTPREDAPDTERRAVAIIDFLRRVGSARVKEISRALSDSIGDDLCAKDVRYVLLIRRDTFIKTGHGIWSLRNPHVESDKEGVVVTSELPVVQEMELADV
jgi:hypothetical protein